ncbi:MULTISPECIES: YihY/virulence factor BrkB family protein [Halomonadaceae]|uniref:YihY/virulence factor BrkB family protein n=2 Tax=Vreelandella TaxID=3137766 RepID=A0A7Z0LS07_9GAMM|nr:MULTISPECIES: YihY/virulence factor BrkB family protein [Halomonas]AJY48888.1 ribonuclease BN [Halomonas sp. KO116]NYS77557.1 YihY/virulence factor BrkB family protein [Halomonas glaciei]|tara:strand:- start:1729 stop:2655 length:927 start_codon:yes stop_codon:yes gene_type:complete
MIRNSSLFNAALLLLPQLAHFSWRVLRNFLKNHGILLAGGVGYNILLSIVPLFAVLVVLLTQVVDQQHLLNVLAIQARHMAPAHAEVLLEAVRSLLDSRDVIGILSFPVLLLFSSFAFRMLEDALAIIFDAPESPHIKRRVWVSVMLPYAFMVVLGAGLMVLTLVVTLASSLNTLVFLLFERELPLASFSEPVLNLASFIGVFLLFSAIYKVLPVVRIALRRAVVGGFVAALLWEGVRLLLVYYFANLSFVNAVYGSLATLVIVLISLEVGAIILLLGAQVIAELERNSRLGLAWHLDPSRQPITRVE